MYNTEYAPPVKKGASILHSIKKYEGYKRIWFTVYILIYKLLQLNFHKLIEQTTANNMYFIIVFCLPLKFSIIFYFSYQPYKYPVGNHWRCCKIAGEIPGGRLKWIV